MEKENRDVEYYKWSLCEADNEVRIQHKTGKALKDVIGAAFENHRKRIWTYFGFEVSKEKHGALFNVDWSITYNSRLIALEEDKGHYIDSCFMERAISGFCKTVNEYQKKRIQVPILIIHSFTRYKKFSEKLEEDMDTRKPEIIEELQKKLVYTTLVDCDRLAKNKWFSSELYDCYSLNVNEEFIIKDIEFIRSLIPIFE
jgi:hypothetical protein